MENFNRLPAEIVLDIVTRLPLESILDCKLVCKPWRKLVSHHPSFSKLHLTHLNRSVESAGKLSYLLYDFYQRLHYFEFNEKHDEIEAPTVTIRRFNLNPPFGSSYKIIGSINGLVCLNGYGDHTTCICNPLTREYLMLPELNRNSYWSTGFGYDSVSNEYKVVEFHRLKGQTNMEVAVYTIGSGKGWRIVGRLDTEFAKICKGHDGVFVNGSLYWMDIKGEKYVVFDLTVEKFGEHVSLPHSEREKCCDYSIGSCGGVFYYATGYYVSKGKHFDMWLLKEKNDMRDMKEQVEHEPLGWRKELSFPVREPLAFTKSGGVLFYENSSFGTYDPLASTSKEVVDCIPLNQVVPHRNTFVSLKELGKENVKYLTQPKYSKKRSRDLLNSC